MNCPDCETPMPVQVCQSAAGYYIGRWCDYCGPWERLSMSYWPTRDEAQRALDEGGWGDRSYAWENQE